MVTSLVVALLASTSPTRLTLTGTEPQLAVTGSKILVAYGREDDLFVARSTDGGKTTETLSMLVVKGRLALGMRRGPRIAASGSTVVVTAIYGDQGNGKDGDLLAWWSHDSGKFWDEPVLVSDVPGSASEGLQGLAASKSGLFASGWLDHRNGKAEIWASTSQNGKPWSKNILVYRSPDGHVCECCHPSAAFGPKGELYIMFRNWLGGSRDMYVATSLDNGKTFRPAVKLGEGTWPLMACPMDGGNIAVTSDGAVQTTWRRNQSVFLDQLGQPESKISAGTQPWIAANGSKLGLVWLQNNQVIAKTPGNESTQLGPGRDPVIAPFGQGFVAAWSDDKNRIHTKLIP